ncbi:MAG: maleylpyruvate isomerase family mycothiol-dependent enzyme [Ilumatobacteraceae bacterium]
MADRLETLESSTSRLASLVQGLAPEQLNDQSYATKWRFTDVLSHLGSGAIIVRRGVDATVSVDAMEDGFNQEVWDEWNAKTPLAKASDALDADSALVDRLTALSDDQRAAFQFLMGPMTLDVDRFMTLRLSEHVLHTWDIDVMLDPDATLPADAVPFVLDVLPMIAGFAGESDGEERVVTINTTNPARAFELTITPDGLVLTPSSEQTSSSPDDVEVSSEELVRLIYGRLDPAHTSSSSESPQLDRLRKLFPGL